jgi:hypothetical protein
MITTYYSAAEIANPMPVGTMVPSEGLWDVCESFRIFKSSFKALIFQLLDNSHSRYFLLI